MKTIYMYIRNPKSVKPKTTRIELVCVCKLEHINTSLSYTISKHKFKLHKSKSSYRTPSPNRLDPNTIQRDSIRVLDAILTRELLNQHVLAPKLFC